MTILNGNGEGMGYNGGLGSSPYATATSAGTSSLTALMNSMDIEPGASLDYNTAKQIYVYHPLGRKIAESPVAMALSRGRKMIMQVPGADKLIEAFNAEWRNRDCKNVLLSAGTQARVYGVASPAIMVDGDDATKPLVLRDLQKKPFALKVFDPLNTAGSLVFNQNPQAFDFQSHHGIAVNGAQYHPSRSRVVQNENPIFIEWTSSAFGFTGRSVFQRSLYPLRSYLRTMITNDMVAYKAGVLVEKIAQPEQSVATNMFQRALGFKRGIVKSASTGNVISIGTGEHIESIDLTNIDKPLSVARANIVKDIASGADMPAQIIDQEALAEGFGEGKEDHERVLHYYQQIREWLEVAYDWLVPIIAWTAWTPEFFDSLKESLPDAYGKRSYEGVMSEWLASIRWEWPELRQPNQREQAELENIKYKSVLDTFQTIKDMVADKDKGKLASWLADNLSTNKTLCPIPLSISDDAPVQEETPATEEKPPRPGGRRRVGTGVAGGKGSS